MEILRNPHAVKRPLLYHRYLSKSKWSRFSSSSSGLTVEWSRSSRNIHKSSAERLRILFDISELGEKNPNSNWCQRRDVCVMASNSGRWESRPPPCGLIVIDKGEAAESFNHLCTSSEQGLYCNHQ